MKNFNVLALSLTLMCAPVCADATLQAAELELQGLALEELTNTDTRNAVVTHIVAATKTMQEKVYAGADYAHTKVVAAWNTTKDFVRSHKKEVVVGAAVTAVVLGGVYAYAYAFNVEEAVDTNNIEDRNANVEENQGDSTLEEAVTEELRADASETPETIVVDGQHVEPVVVDVVLTESKIEQAKKVANRVVSVVKAKLSDAATHAAHDVAKPASTLDADDLHGYMQ